MIWTSRTEVTLTTILVVALLPSLALGLAANQPPSAQVFNEPVVGSLQGADPQKIFTECAQYKEYLLALYNQCGGVGWKNNHGWSSSDVIPVEKWFGVSCVGSVEARRGSPFCYLNVSLPNNNVGCPGVDGLPDAFTSFVDNPGGFVGGYQLLNLEHNTIKGTFSSSLLRLFNPGDSVHNEPAPPAMLRRMWVLMKNNELHGALPPPPPNWDTAFINKLNTVAHIDLSNNHLSGSVILDKQVFGGQLLSSSYLNLSHNDFTGPLPNNSPCLFPHTVGVSCLFTPLQLDEAGGPYEHVQPAVVDLSHNGFSGAVPETLLGVTFVSHVDLSHNNLETFAGCFRPNVGKTVANGAPTATINMSHNRFVSLETKCNADDDHPQAESPFVRDFYNSPLGWLDVSNSGALASISSDLCSQMKSNVVLDVAATLYLHDNRLGPTLPSACVNAKGGILKTIFAARNHFSGPVPSDLFTDSALEVVDLSHNRFTSLDVNPITPQETGVQLHRLDLSFNQIDSTLPEHLGSYNALPSTAWFIFSLDLSFNFIHGPIPAKWSTTDSLSAISNLNLAENALTGSWSDGLNNIGSCDGPTTVCLGTKSVNVSGNQLSGVLPSDVITSVSKANGWRVLDVSKNNIGGVVPNVSSEAAVLALQDVHVISFANNPKMHGVLDLVPLARAINAAKKQHPDQLPQEIDISGTSIGACNTGGFRVAMQLEYDPAMTQLLNVSSCTSSDVLHPPTNTSSVHRLNTSAVLYGNGGQKLISEKVLDGNGTPTGQREWILSPHCKYKGDILYETNVHDTEGDGVVCHDQQAILEAFQPCLPLPAADHSTYSFVTFNYNSSLTFGVNAKVNTSLVYLEHSTFCAVTEAGTMFQFTFTPTRQWDGTPAIFQELSAPFYDSFGCSNNIDVPNMHVDTNGTVHAIGENEDVLFQCWANDAVTAPYWQQSPSWNRAVLINSTLYFTTSDLPWYLLKPETNGDVLSIPFTPQQCRLQPVQQYFASNTYFYSPTPLTGGSSNDGIVLTARNASWTLGSGANSESQTQGPISLIGEYVQNFQSQFQYIANDNLPSPGAGQWIGWRIDYKGHTASLLHNGSSYGDTSTNLDFIQLQPLAIGDRCLVTVDGIRVRSSFSHDRYGSIYFSVPDEANQSWNLDSNINLMAYYLTNHTVPFLDLSAFTTSFSSFTQECPEKDILVFVDQQHNLMMKGTRHNPATNGPAEITLNFSFATCARMHPVPASQLPNDESYLLLLSDATYAQIYLNTNATANDDGASLMEITSWSGDGAGSVENVKKQSVYTAENVKFAQGIVVTFGDAMQPWLDALKGFGVRTELIRGAKLVTNQVSGSVNALQFVTLTEAPVMSAALSTPLFESKNTSFCAYTLDGMLFTLFFAPREGLLRLTEHFTKCDSGFLPFPGAVHQDGTIPAFPLNAAALKKCLDTSFFYKDGTTVPSHVVYRSNVAATSGEVVFNFSNADPKSTAQQPPLRFTLQQCRQAYRQSTPLKGSYCFTYKHDAWRVVAQNGTAHLSPSGPAFVGVQMLSLGHPITGSVPFGGVPDNAQLVVNNFATIRSKWGDFLPVLATGEHFVRAVANPYSYIELFTATNVSVRLDPVLCNSITCPAVPRAPQGVEPSGAVHVPSHSKYHSVEWAPCGVTGYWSRSFSPADKLISVQSLVVKQLMTPKATGWHPIDPTCVPVCSPLFPSNCTAVAAQVADTASCYLSNAQWPSSSNYIDTVSYLTQCTEGESSLTKTTKILTGSNFNARPMCLDDDEYGEVAVILDGTNTTLFSGRRDKCFNGISISCTPCIYYFAPGVTTTPYLFLAIGVFKNLLIIISVTILARQYFGQQIASKLSRMYSRFLLPDSTPQNVRESIESHIFYTILTTTAREQAFVEDFHLICGFDKDGNRVAPETETEGLDQESPELLKFYWVLVTHRGRRRILLESSPRPSQTKFSETTKSVLSHDIASNQSGSSSCVGDRNLIAVRKILRDAVRSGAIKAMQGGGPATETPNTTTVAVTREDDEEQDSGADAPRGAASTSSSKFRATTLEQAALLEPSSPLQRPARPRSVLHDSNQEIEDAIRAMRCNVPRPSSSFAGRRSGLEVPRPSQTAPLGHLESVHRDRESLAGLASLSSLAATKEGYGSTNEDLEHVASKMSKQTDRLSPKKATEPSRTLSDVSLKTHDKQPLDSSGSKVDVSVKERTSLPTPSPSQLLADSQNFNGDGSHTQQHQNMLLVGEAALAISDALQTEVEFYPCLESSLFIPDQILVPPAIALWFQLLCNILILLYFTIDASQDGAAGLSGFKRFQITYLRFFNTASCFTFLVDSGLRYMSQFLSFNPGSTLRDVLMSLLQSLFPCLAFSWQRVSNDEEDDPRAINDDDGDHAGDVKRYSFMKVTVVKRHRGVQFVIPQRRFLICAVVLILPGMLNIVVGSIVFLPITVVYVLLIAALVYAARTMHVASASIKGAVMMALLRMLITFFVTCLLQSTFNYSTFLVDATNTNAHLPVPVNGSSKSDHDDPQYHARNPLSSPEGWGGIVRTEFESRSLACSMLALRRNIAKFQIILNF